MRQVLIGGSLVLALTLGAGSTPAEEPEAASPLRLYHVGALTMGRSDFIPRVLGLVGPDSVSDEAHPLFGAEGEEPLLPVGTADEIVELLRYQVDPGSWESVAGAFVHAMGEATLLVRQQPEALVGVGQAIRRMEDRWLRPITLDVVAVRLPRTLGAAPSASELEALATAEASGPSISLTVFPTQRVTAFSGRQLSYLLDYDVEVAQKAKISDPIVGTLNAGLGVSARASVSEAGDRVRLDLNAELVELLRMDTLAAGDGRTLDAPVVGTTVTRTSAELTTGAWTLLEGSGARAEGGGVVFLARARLGSRSAGAPSPGLALPVLESAGMAKLPDRACSIALLTQPVHSRLSRWLDIMPSNFTPPEPPELPEPIGAVQSDRLLEIMRQAIAPEAWGARGGSAEVRSDTLYVRAPETALLAVERMLAALEHALLWAVDVEGRLGGRGRRPSWPDRCCPGSRGCARQGPRRRFRPAARTRARQLAGRPAQQRVGPGAAQLRVRLRGGDRGGCGDLQPRGAHPEQWDRARRAPADHLHARQRGGLRAPEPQRALPGPAPGQDRGGRDPVPRHAPARAAHRHRDPLRPHGRGRRLRRPGRPSHGAAADTPPHAAGEVNAAR
jgi:hypothetical protein